MSINPFEPIPAARPVDVTPIPGESGDRFLLRDRAGYASNELVLSGAGYFVWLHLDGERSIADVQRAFSEQFAATPPHEDIAQLIVTLEQQLLLRSERFEKAQRQRRGAYRSAPSRDNRDRWPAAAALRTEIEQMLATAPPRPAARQPRGLIAPHLDYARGGPAYAAAFAAVRSAPAFARYVILGTNHAGESRRTVATRQTFHTPLGKTATDTAFIEALGGRLGRDLCEWELDHELEHSIEIQVHILQALYPASSFQIVPLLCPDPSAGDPNCDADELADALRALLASDDTPTLLLASADFSHVGAPFGDEPGTAGLQLPALDAYDQALLKRLLAGDPAGFAQAVRACHNQTRICSVGCVYVLARALGGTGELLMYHQAADEAADTYVTCAAAIYP